VFLKSRYNLQFLGFWVVALCNMVVGYEAFGRSCCLHFHLRENLKSYIRNLYGEVTMHQKSQVILLCLCHWGAETRISSPTLQFQYQFQTQAARKRAYTLYRAQATWGLSPALGPFKALQPRRWRQHGPPKRWYLTTTLHGRKPRKPRNVRSLTWKRKTSRQAMTYATNTSQLVPETNKRTKLQVLRTGS